MTSPETDWDTVMEMEAESRRDAGDAETKPATCPRCGHAIDGRSPHPPECAECPEGYCESPPDVVWPDPLPPGFIVPKPTPFRPVADEDVDFADEWDDAESSAYHDRVEAGLEQEDSSDEH
jgi:hypothetical protein